MPDVTVRLDRKLRLGEQAVWAQDELVDKYVDKLLEHSVVVLPIDDSAVLRDAALRGELAAKKFAQYLWGAVQLLCYICAVDDAGFYPVASSFHLSHNWRHLVPISRVGLLIFV